MPRFQTRDGTRLHWRVIVQSASKQDGSRGGPKMAWHLVECADPLLEAAHCPAGRLLLSGGADPDGHCLIDGACPRCASLDTATVNIVTPGGSPPAVARQAAEAVPSGSADRGAG